MSGRYTGDGRRRSSMAHARHPHYFDCGKVCFGNGYRNHRLAHGCTELTTTQWMARLHENTEADPPKPKRERIDWSNVVVDEGDEAP